MSTVFAKIQMRRGTAAEWAAANPVLAQGEMAFETDTGLTKIGDGATAYLTLPAYATYDQMLAAKVALDEAALDVAAVEASRIAASGFAQTAAQRAGEATNAAAAALQSEQNIVAKVNEAEQARIDAIAYAGVAEQKADEIVASAQAAADNAAAADADRIAAQDARTGAEAAQGIAEQAAADALSSEQVAISSAEAATGAAAQSLAIYGSVAAQQAAVANAQAQASLAAGFAASAASVVQQDLSGVTAQALHRSPNAVTAMFLYDTSKDSDGGAWTEKCQHTSWWNEPIYGKWLGAQASETTARAVSGATTGDYFQRSTDGRFYALNAGSGITEVFRGNKRDFPRLAGIVAEAGNVTIYDLTEPGRPMWLRAVGGAYTAFPVGGVSSIAALNGIVCVGGNNAASSFAFAGLRQVNFPLDTIRKHTSNNGHSGLFPAGVASRNMELFNPTGSEQLIANAVVNAVAMTVLPDAPTDPVTGLKVPTIAVANAGGVSVIQDEGLVRNSAFTFSFDALVLTPSLLSAGRGGDANWYHAANPGALGASFALAFRSGIQAPGFGIGNTGKLVDTGRARLLRRSTTAARVQLARAHESDQARSLVATVGDTFNTGHMTGDIRRCFLSDTAVGSASQETIANESFDTGTGGFVGMSGGITTAASVGGELEVTISDGGRPAVSRSYTVVPGMSYRLSVKARRGNTSQVAVRAGTTDFGIDYGSASTLQLTLTTLSITFRAVTSTLWVSLGYGQTAVGQINYFDDLLIESVDMDRSYRNATANFTGTLTRAQLASGTSLVGYSGFSAANYLREPYSADLDFGTGEWTASAWVNIPTGVTAAAVIFERAAASGASIRFGITSLGQLTATAFDGTTTRTVTTTQAFKTAQWIKARVSYTTDGTLAILVNGREVAATRGTPLLTLNNAAAVLTIGNSFALDAPFPGSIALLKLGATVPSLEQATFMYEQEKQLFRAGAECVLPDSGAIVDMAYDDATDRWVAMSAANESYWTGLVRNSVQAVPAGSFSRVVAGSGLELAARTGTNPGVDVTIPAYGLREELVKRAEAAARLSREVAVYDFVGGFTASTTNGSTAITSVAGLTYPRSLIGARVSGSGIPAGARIVGVSGTTIYLSAAATASATGVAISFLDFNLPVGMQALSVLSGGTLRREGSTADFTRLYDGFLETIRFAVAPGSSAWVQIQATRGTMQ